jgi:hypothetical protein
MSGEPDILVWVADPGASVDKVVQLALESQKISGVDVRQYTGHDVFVSDLKNPQLAKPDAVLVSSYMPSVVTELMGNIRYTGIAVAYYSWTDMRKQAETESVHYIHKDDRASLAAFIASVRKMKEFSQRADKALPQ